MSRGIAPKAVGEQHILELLHQHGQHPVGVGDGEAQPLWAAVPHQAVGQLVRVQPGEYRHRGQGDGGHLQGEDQQGRHCGGVASEQQRHDKEIPCLREHPQGKEEQHQPRHSRQEGGGHHQQEAPQQEGNVAHEPGHQAEEQIPGQQDSGVQAGDHGVIVAIGVLQHLIAQEVHGELIQDALREFCGQFFHSGHAS